MGEFVNRARIARAKQLLGNSRLSMAEIASEIGYARQSSFTERFKDEVGMTPTEWRRARSKDAAHTKNEQSG